MMMMARRIAITIKSESTTFHSFSGLDFVPNKYLLVFTALLFVSAPAFFIFTV